MDLAAPTTLAAPRPAALLDELALLADSTRCRAMAILTRHELTVAELCDVLALPQSTVSRHLKVIADAGWVTARPDGARRYYAATVDRLGDRSRRLWELVREHVADSPAAELDERRLAQVLARRTSASAAFIAQASADWDALRADLFGPAIDARILPALVDPDAIAVDLGCGGGHLAAALAPHVARVIGVDASPEMLAVAAARTVDAPNVELREGPLEALPVADGAVDLALCVLVLHRVADPGRVLDEAARVLVPGGRLLLADMLPHADEEYRRTMGHVWLGFDPSHVRGLLVASGLEVERVVSLPPVSGARGPGLIVATARRTTTTPTERLRGGA